MVMAMLVDVSCERGEKVRVLVRMRGMVWCLRWGLSSWWGGGKTTLMMKRRSLDSFLLG